LVVVLLWAVPSLAQTGVPAAWTVRIYQAGQTAPIQTFTVTAPLCNQAPPPVEPSPVVNPTTHVWDDPVNLSRVCLVHDAPRLAALEDGAYESTVSASNAANDSSAETPRVPFVRRRPNPPAAPTGYRLIRQG
jgi:hypothetical protein